MHHSFPNEALSLTIHTASLRIKKCLLGLSLVFSFSPLFLSLHLHSLSLSFPFSLPFLLPEHLCLGVSFVRRSRQANRLSGPRKALTGANKFPIFSPRYFVCERFLLLVFPDGLIFCFAVQIGRFYCICVCT